ncbi:hypothetical protein [Nocardia sp. NPDC052566]|uniref:hypothetical protein n=1 Tax=Nocardia sp. NPDC052566 TaxID=3364330 RepID=UPI0037C60F7D
MTIRLAWGVIAERDRKAWLADTGAPVDPRAHDLSEGAAIVLGPEDAAADRVAVAREQLAQLIKAGGVVVAGAGVDLGDGFVSARLLGATGDRRDAVFAALRVLGLDGAHRLGERTATLVALFGLGATKPVGAAAESAIDAGQWGAVHLASAAADILGPEQLEKVLALRTPDDIDMNPVGAPSALAENLRRVFEPQSRQRRSVLLIDLWEQVCAVRSAAHDRARLIARQDQSLLPGLRERYRRFDDDLAIQLVHDWIRQPPTIASAARFVPTWENFWSHCLTKLLQDAIAATVLLRAALAVNKYGAVEGMTRVAGQFAAASALVSGADARRAQRKAPEVSPLAARPVCAVRELDAWLRYRPLDAGFEILVRKRLATALAYGTVVFEACHTMLHGSIEHRSLVYVRGLADNWDLADLHTWRAAVGYTDIRPPTAWNWHQMVWEGAPSLAARLAEDPAATEKAADLMWYGELADALAQIRGHRAAAGHESYYAYFDIDPERPKPEPMTPRLDSLPLAMAGAAQLISLGATVPVRCRDWGQLCAGLMKSGAAAQALTSEFDVPDEILAEDGQILPDTTARIQVARGASLLADWSDYMGNCIAGPRYQVEASAGRSVLIALRDAAGTILVNAELRTMETGWRLAEARTRFNDDPDPDLRQALHRWVWHLKPSEPELDVANIEPPLPSTRRRSASNPVRDIAPALRREAERTLSETAEALTVFAALAGHATPDPKTLTALRRMSADRLATTCADALATGAITLPELWSATAARPLTAAVAALDSASLARYPRLHRLSDDAPLPSKSLRALVKDPTLATARSMDLIGARLRTAILTLARTDHPVLTQAIRRDPTPDLLCPLILAITCTADGSIPTTAITTPGEDTVPGFPATTLSDPNGPWHRAWPTATELGATPTKFATRTTKTGALAPTSWLTPAGWPALWRRATIRSGLPHH